MPSFPDSPVHLREARLEDAVQIAELGSHIFSVTFGHSVTPEQLQAYLNESYTITAISKDITNPLKDTIVASTEDGVVVGFAILTRGTSEPCVAHLENVIELQRLYVHLDCHGKGIGKTLAQKVESMARERGFKNMWLGVWEENYNAQKVYKKLGYKTVGDHPFALGDIVQTDLIMAKEL